MTSTDTQIKKAYEEAGMTPAQIAEDQDFDVVAVKSKLMQLSSKYRTDCGLEVKEESVLNFDESEQRQVKDMILSLALGAEDENLRGKMCMYVRDDALGRKDINKAAQVGATGNIFVFNEMIQQARLRAVEVKSTITKQLLPA